MMRHDLYEDLYLKEHDYWWHVGKRLIVYRLLARYVPRPTGNPHPQRRALDLGVNWVDTAPGYADSEEVLGLALSGMT